MDVEHLPFPIRNKAIREDAHVADEEDEANLFPPEKAAYLMAKGFSLFAFGFDDCILDLMAPCALDDSCIPLVADDDFDGNAWQRLLVDSVNYRLQRSSFR